MAKEVNRIHGIIDNLFKEFQGYQNNRDSLVTSTESLREANVRRGTVGSARVALVDRLIRDHGLTGQRILEIGAGLGDFHRLVQATGQEVELTLSDKEVKRLKANVDPKVSVTELDIYALNLPNDSQENIVMTNLFEQLLRPKEALQEVHRVLQPGGRLIILTDLMPDEFLFFLRYRDYYLIPLISTSAEPKVNYVALSEEEANWFGNQQPPHTKEVWRAYVKERNPWRRALFRRAFPDVMGIFHVNMATLLAQNRLMIRPMVIDSAYECHKGAADIMDSGGWRDVMFTLKQAEHIGPATDIQVPGTEYNYAFDRLVSTRDPGLGLQVREIAYAGMVTGIK